MRIFRQVRGAFLCLLCVTSLAPMPGLSVETGTGYGKLSAWKLDELVEPIALYPDVLIKAILPASTFPDQIIDAALLIRGASEAKLIKDQRWDTSVKVVATYPGVLQMMVDKLEWTIDLGEAFLNQNRELLAALQRKRKEAKDLGNLESNQHQVVSTETTKSGDTIVIVQPTNPEVVYVPQTTTVVYDQPSTAETMVPLATFGMGMAIGAAMADDDDDDHYYYGGPVYWDDDDHFDDWIDHRNEMWDDYNDRRNDAQDFRQDQRGDRQDFRQDNFENGTWNKEAAAQRRQEANSRVNDYKAKNPNAGARADAWQGSGSGTRTGTSSKGSFSKTSSQNWQTAGSFDTRPAAQTKRTTQRPATLPSYSGSSGAFQGYGSNRSASAMSQRGSASRSSSGFSGGRSGSFGGGGGRSFGGGGGRRR